MRITGWRSTEGIGVRNWASYFEEGVHDQADHLARLPFAHHHIALMPDTHPGYGMPIGGVLATRGVVVPNAVGVDIGCGMRAFNTGYALEEVSPVLDKLMLSIKRGIPTGFNHHKVMQDDWLYEEVVADMQERAPVVFAQYTRSLYQVGTLGGGNHFIEAQHCEETDTVWFMIHSGSRNLGKQVADYYNKQAIQENARWHSSVPKNWELAFLPMNHELGRRYLTEMSLCLQFAQSNRERMALVIQEQLGRIFGGYYKRTEYDIHHNYANMEHWHGQNVMVHRKGAVRAKGEWVIIPGSMGTKSYICTGLDNPESFGSASHGAGRRMGRKAATKDEVVQQSLADMQTALYTDGDARDEAPGAYKDIDDVMEDQTDLVTPRLTLTPLAVIKG